MYVHRVGRTGRAGKGGDAVLVLAPFEQELLKELHDIPIADHELAPSELEIGAKEERTFKLAKDVPPLGMQEEAVQALAGYCISLMNSFG